MGYIGVQPAKGQYRKLTDISSGFNGSATSFQLSVPPGGVNYYIIPSSPQQLMVSVGGIIQNPGVDYTTTGSQIIFTTAPAAGLSFFGTFLGDVGNGVSSSSITYQGTGTGAVSRLLTSKLGDTVSVKDFGAVGDGVTNDTAAIQAAINYAQSLKNRPTILIPVGKYKITSTITIAESYVSLVGLGMPSSSRGDDSSNTTRGATFRYYGTGTALLIGVAPGTNGTFIEGIVIENLRIEVDNNTVTAMQVWQSSGGYFNNITIFGNKGAGTKGLWIQGGISNIYERIDIVGLGQTPAVGYANCMEYGLRAGLGYLNQPITTTTFRRCYFHYCNNCVGIDYQVNFEDCIFEAANIGVSQTSLIYSRFLRCWWEAINVYDLSIGNGFCSIVDSNINFDGRQVCMATGPGVGRLILTNNIFSATDATPYLFYTSNNICQSTGSVTISGCTFPANMKIGGSGNPSLQGYDKIVISDMRTVVYRFKATGASGTVTYNPMPTEGGLTSYTLPTAGQLLGLNIYASATVTAGQLNIRTYLNGVEVPLFSYPDPFTITSFPFSLTRSPFDKRFNAGDKLTISFGLGTIAPTVDFTCEVIAALGPDGL